LSSDGVEADREDRRRGEGEVRSPRDRGRAPARPDRGRQSVRRDRGLRGAPRGGLRRMRMGDGPGQTDRPDMEDGVLEVVEGGKGRDEEIAPPAFPRAMAKMVDIGVKPDVR